MSAMPRKSDNSSPRRKLRLKENSINEKRTQTSKTILQLAALEIDKNLKSDTSPTREEQKMEKKESKREREHFSTINIDHVVETPLMTPNLSSDIFESAVTGEKELIPASHWSRFTIKQIRLKSFIPSESPQTSVVPRGLPRHCVSFAEPPTTIKNSTMDADHKSTGDYTDSVINLSLRSSESRFTDMLHMLLHQAKSKDWECSLKAMVEIVDHLEDFDQNRLLSHMPEVNQRLIEFLRNPRTQICRHGCQIAAKLFEYVKDTRRPEFDELVDLLLAKTADANKFLRKDSNVALDSLVMYISPYHTIRAISSKGPYHKNDFVRITAARLIVCVVGIAGINFIFNNSGSDATRKRMLACMIRFIKDKNFKVREYGVRLYTLLHVHPNFDLFLRKLVNKSSITDIRKVLKEKISTR